MRSFLIILIAATLYYLYIEFISPKWTKEFPILVNMIIIPILLGAASALTLSKTLKSEVRVGLVALAPVLAIIAISPNGDPAKPDLEYLILGVLIITFSVGAIAGVMVRNLNSKGNAE